METSPSPIVRAGPGYGSRLRRDHRILASAGHRAWRRRQGRVPTPWSGAFPGLILNEADAALAAGHAGVTVNAQGSCER